jgi:hypothetical protein
MLYPGPANEPPTFAKCAYNVAKRKPVLLLIEDNHINLKVLLGPRLESSFLSALPVSGLMMAKPLETFTKTTTSTTPRRMVCSHYKHFRIHRITIKLYSWLSRIRILTFLLNAILTKK